MPPVTTIRKEFHASWETWRGLKRLDYLRSRLNRNGKHWIWVDKSEWVGMMLNGKIVDVMPYSSEILEDTGCV